MTTLRSWYAAGRWVFVARFAAIGAVAGLASWILVLVLHLLFDVSRPGVRALVLAVPRGALFGGLLALALGAYWDWRAARGIRGKGGGRWCFRWCLSLRPFPAPW